MVQRLLASLALAPAVLALAACAGGGDGGGDGGHYTKGGSKRCLRAVGTLVDEWQYQIHPSLAPGGAIMLTLDAGEQVTVLFMNTEQRAERFAAQQGRAPDHVYTDSGRLLPYVSGTRGNLDVRQKGNAVLDFQQIYVSYPPISEEEKAAVESCLA